MLRFTRPTLQSRAKVPIGRMKKTNHPISRQRPAGRRQAPCGTARGVGIE
jgi:hypothetical protein